MNRSAKVALAMSFGSLVIGCGQGAGVTTNYSDRQILEGVVFGVGPVADVLPEARENLRPELYARSPDELSALAQARKATIDAIELNHPGFMSEFAQAARSGDPAKVRAMLARTMGAISEASTLALAMREPNVPINLVGREPNVPINTANREPNVPINLVGREPNVPINTANREPNVPINLVGLEPNVPVQLVAVHPAWDLLTSRLFSEQLSSSVAMTFGPRADER